ncbi:hypothetical protein CBL_12429 [Carabus blaptoides fortunei]
MWFRKQKHALFTCVTSAGTDVAMKRPLTTNARYKLPKQHASTCYVSQATTHARAPIKTKAKFRSGSGAQHKAVPPVVISIVRPYRSGGGGTTCHPLCAQRNHLCLTAHPNTPPSQLSVTGGEDMQLDNALWICSSRRSPHTHTYI